MSRQQQAFSIQDEHRRLEGMYGDCDGKDWIVDVESYYVRKPRNFVSKLKTSEIEKDVVAHMIRHIAAVLRGRGRERKQVRRVTFVVFARNPTATRASTKRFNYGKHRNGTVWKREKSTGRFARFSKREREVLRKRQT